MATKKDTPARRARSRRNPAVATPPPRIKGGRKTSVKNLTLRSVAGKPWAAGIRAFPIGANIEGDTPWSMGMDQAMTIQLPIRNPSGEIVDALDDESHLQENGVIVVVDGVNFAVTGVDHDGEGLYTLTVEDEVAWRLKQFSKFLHASRASVTRFGFIWRMVQEAGRKPYPKIRTFIPEIKDRQKILKPKKTS